MTVNGGYFTFFGEALSVPRKTACLLWMSRSCISIGRFKPGFGMQLSLRDPTARSYISRTTLDSLLHAKTQRKFGWSRIQQTANGIGMRFLISDAFPESYAAGSDGKPPVQSFSSKGTAAVWTTSFTAKLARIHRGPLWLVPAGGPFSVHFTKMPSLHHNKCGGIVDNDGRSEADIKMLNGLGIAVLPVASVETLFLLESVLVVAAEKLGHTPAEALPKVKERIFSALRITRFTLFQI